MPKIHDRWTVLPHGPLREVDDGILTVEGLVPFPLGSFPRRMTVVRLAEGGTALYSAMALSEPEMAKLEAFGEPRVLIVPSPYHRIDSRIYKQRYRQLRVLTPPGARKRVEEAVTVDWTSDMLGDPAVQFVTVGGTKSKESALIVTRAGATTLIVNDVIGNVIHPHGFGGKAIARLVGYYGRPQVPRTVRYLLIDRKGLAAQFRTWAKLPRLERIIMSHGDIIIGQPAATLERLADELD